MAAVCATFGVGELSAINAIAGSYAEHLPGFHLVGVPGIAVQKSRRAMHHTLGTGDFDLFRRMTEPVVAAWAVMTPQNVAAETERLIAAALYHRRPVYMAFPADLADRPVLGSAAPNELPRSNPASLAAAADAVAPALAAAATACVLPGILLDRHGLRGAAQGLIDVSGLPFATMFMDKSVLDETQPGYLGMYDGAIMEEPVRAFVERADRVLALGTLASDFNTGAFTARLDPARLIAVGHHAVHMGGRTFPDVELGDFVAALADRLPRRDWPWQPPPARPAATGSGDDVIDVAALYPRWEAFLKPGDILVAETGTASMGLGFAPMPAGARFHNQTLWGSIGRATPAAVGAAAATSGGRVVLVTGDGSHQLTAQEIGQFGRLGLRPVVFVLNTNGDLIERLLCKDPAIASNDIAPWRSTELPHAFGCDGWLTARVITCAELEAALAAAQTAETGVYIEVVTGAYAATELAEQLYASKKSLYNA